MKQILRKKIPIGILALFFLLSSNTFMNAQCDYVEGTISFAASGGNTDADYENLYLLVNNSGTIVQRSSTTEFTAVTEGNYTIYNVNFETTTSGGEGTSVTGISVNDPISGIGGTCYALSAGLTIEVCKIEIEWSDATATGAEDATSYQPTLTISGADITSALNTTTIEVAFSGTATLGTDYNPSSSPVTLTIPKGDYSSATTLNFNDLTSSGDISIIDDIIVESSETMVLTLQNAVGMDIGDVDNSTSTETVHTYTITDNDALIVEFAEATGSDAEATGGNLPSITVSGAQITSDVTVEVAFTGTATLGTDYALASSGTSPITLTIPAGNYGTATDLVMNNLTTNDLSITDDSVVESDETVVMTLQNASSGLSIGDADGGSSTESVHTYTITDDETLIVEFTDATASDAEATGGNLPSITVSGAEITSDVTVEVAFTGTATAGTDYALASAGTSPITLTIPAGDYNTATDLVMNNLTTNDLSITDDSVVESDETIVMTLQNASGVTIGDADGGSSTETVHTYTITDDETLIVEFTDATASDAEATGGNLPSITVSGAEITSDVTVEVAFTGTATAGTDYALASAGTSPITLTIPAGDYNTATDLVMNNLTTNDLSITDDSVVESNETIVMTLQNASGVTIGDADGGSSTESVHTYTITDDETLVVEWAEATASDAETTGGNLPSITVSGAEITSDVTVEVAFTGTATAGTDYALASAGTSPITLTIPAGDYNTATDLVMNNLTTNDLSITDDTVIEGDETVVMTLQNASGVTIGDADGGSSTESVHTYTITDDDTLLIEFASTSGTSSEGTGGDLPQFTISGAEITSPVTIEVVLTDGTTSSGDYDFASGGSSPITITIPIGDYSSGSTLNLNDLTTTDLSIVDDALVEADETFTLTFQNPSGISVGDADGTDGTESTFVYTIQDDDCAASARTLTKQ